jgi:lambda family phage portal protein
MKLFPFVTRKANAMPPSRQRATGELVNGVNPALAATASLEAAARTPRTSGWQPQRLHLNTILATEGPLLRARARSMVANTPLGSNASEVFTGFATGTGIRPSPKLQPRLKAKVVEAFEDWTDEADADGLTDFYGLQSLAARALYDVGEVFIRRRDRYVTDGFFIPMQIQLLESEQLDQSYSLGTVPGGGYIRQGIEFNAIGQRVAYHFWRQHPGDYVPNQRIDRTRVPAEQVLHLFKPLRPGQIRGRPWLTPGLVKAYEYDQYTDAEIVRKKGAAMFMAWITRKLGVGEEGSLPGIVEEGATADSAGSVDVVMEPGTVPVLPEGMEVSFNNPADVGPNFEAFSYRAILELCAAWGLPYHSVTMDTSKANYSSLRAALLEVKRRIEQFQNEVMIYQMCRGIWQWWFPTAILAGAFSVPGYANNPRTYLRCLWRTPKWDWVDPLKDVQAEKAAVDAGFKARSAVIEERGEDPEIVDEQIAADQMREKRLGISFAVGIRKNPDQPTGTTDTQQQPQGGEPGDNNNQTAAAAEGDLVERMAEGFTAAVAAMPAPQIRVEVPISVAQGDRSIVSYDTNGRVIAVDRQPSIRRVGNNG